MADDVAEKVADTIQRTAATEKISDGKFFIIDVEKAVRIRTGETNDDDL